MEMAVGVHDERRIWVKLMYFRAEDLQALRQMEGRLWLTEEKVWLLPYSISSIVRLFDAYPDAVVKVEPKLADECPYVEEYLRKRKLAQSGHEEEAEYPWDAKHERKLLEQIKLRGYSPKTIKAYRSQIRRFCAYTRAEQQ